MASRKLKAARAVAIEALSQCDPQKNYAGPILDELLNTTSEKQRATDLVFGTMRNRRAVDAVIGTFSGRPVERIEKQLLNIIRVGTYELVYSPATEEYAIVSEAVENAKALAGNKQAGFVNAVLRQIARHVTSREIHLSQADAKRTLVQTLSTGCEFDAKFLPDSQACPADYLSTVFSLPRWLVADWLDEFGPELTQQICFASNRRPSIYLRPNTLKTTAQELANKFAGEKVDLEMVEGTMIRLKRPKAIRNLPGFAEGLFVVQDITASKAVEMLNPQRNWNILDLCAAPGTKAIQLAEATGDSAKIVATDIDSQRLEMVQENTARLGIDSVTIVAYTNLQSIAAENAPYDAVLLDVPCSNTGVLAKRVEARYRLNPKAIEELANIQRELLNTATAMVKPQGKICYSTCSIQKDENSELARDFLKANHNFELESEKLTLPSAEGFDHDGGYVAIIKRE